MFVKQKNHVFHIKSSAYLITSKCWTYNLSALCTRVFLYSVMIIYALWSNKIIPYIFSRQNIRMLLYCQFHTWTNLITYYKTEIVLEAEFIGFFLPITFCYWIYLCYFSNICVWFLKYLQSVSLQLFLVFYRDQLKTLGTQMGYPIRAVVKINDQSFSTEFCKPKRFQLFYQITIYTAVVFY